MKITRELVSVPCRGLIFLNGEISKKQTERKKVSVPCRGLIFLNPKEKDRCPEAVRVSVPCRGLIFLNFLCIICRMSSSCFRPLSGTYISQLKRLFGQEPEKWFPSPVGDLYFSIL